MMAKRTSILYGQNLEDLEKLDYHATWGSRMPSSLYTYICHGEEWEKNEL